MNEVVVLNAVRSPIGSFNGSLSTLEPPIILDESL